MDSVRLLMGRFSGCLLIPCWCPHILVGRNAGSLPDKGENIESVLVISLITQQPAYPRAYSIRQYLVHERPSYTQLSSHGSALRPGKRPRTLSARWYSAEAPN